jgi:hypothetical protein
MREGGPKRPSMKLGSDGSLYLFDGRGCHPQTRRRDEAPPRFGRTVGNSDIGRKRPSERSLP